ncbi:MAG: hypothetical protein JSV13_08920 [Nitrospiraceae bacterium]|nr:MAG: hypothetical protein JSV13_08920 [Nitrospiraceae bacterium]
MVIRRDLRHFSVLLITACFLFFIPVDSLSKSAVVHESESRGSDDKAYLRVRIKRDISLDELITNVGYDIDDDSITLFLEDFARENEQLKSLSKLRKGVVVKLPLRYLKRKTTLMESLAQIPEDVKRKRKTPKTPGVPVKKAKKTPVTIRKTPALNREVVLRNVRMLADFFDDRMAVKDEGFKIFQINERSEVSLDTTFFPLLQVNDKRILVIDYLGILPHEVRNMVELAWPEYRIVSNGGKDDLKHIVGRILDALGYRVSKNKRILIGGKTQIEYLSDFLVYPEDKDILEDDLFIISVIESKHYASPEILVDLLDGKGIRLLEMYKDKDTHEYRANTSITHIEPGQSPREFTETVLSLLGYHYTKDTVMNISKRKEFRYTLTADLSISSGGRKKIVEFIELSPYELEYAKKMGFDIAMIELKDDRRDIIKKIINLFSLHHRSSPRANARSVTPPNVKYRLLPNGFFVNSIKGPVFFMDTVFRPDLIQQIVDDKHTYITF